MPTVSEIMSTDVQVVGPEESLQRAAQLMDQLNVGSLPVCDGTRLLGMVTDRDITIRGTAAGLAPDAGCVSDVMTEELQWCTEDQDTEEVMRVMADAQVRRLPVISIERDLVGIVSLGDLATRTPSNVDDVMRSISSPSEADGGAASS
ncbi:CBS domain-containing protein [Aquabacterium sp.]|uniref:CBS domain-containing protein n=1 Tax=Aquabacterium sp. TaxID=1872578 RepID=UPI002CE24609|nr:CBS domain-containing protein [Aquabacterium sp.]HSW04617.1 CBS domain-containing protein [Aquabacterium sp.]